MDFLKINHHNNTRKFYELNMTNNLIPTILRPTRVTDHSATLIDNIYIDAELYTEIESFVIPSNISDHFLCVVKFQCDVSRNNRENNIYTRREINESALRNIKRALFNNEWSYLEQYDVSEASMMLNAEITKAMDFYAPLKTFAPKQRYKRKDPWFTTGLRISSTKCLKMYKNVLHLPRDNPEFIKYKNYRNIYKKVRRQAKFKYIDNLINIHRNDTKKLWTILNKLTGKKKNSSELPDEFIIDGVKQTNAQIISDGFAHYYGEIGKNMAEKIEKSGQTQDPLLNMRNSIPHNCFFFPTNHTEIQRFIKGLKSKNSKGHDEITNTILKAIYPSIINALTIIFNKSLSCGDFPINMKLAIVKPLYKGKNKLEINNYRPISLLPTISKILEKIVNFRLNNFFNKYNIIYEGQYGFRKNRSTIDAVLDLTGNIIEGFDRGMYTLALFLDMSKAFDSIKHDTLLKKLEFYGIRGTALKWITSYLSDRSLKVVFKNVLSKKVPLSYGTPQGSVLGPVLYSILANDLPKCLKFCNSVIYADDTTVFVTGNNLRFLYRKLNEDLLRLVQWFQNNSLSLNIEKSNYMLFKTRNRTPHFNGRISIKGKSLTKIDSTKFLGLYIDEHLDWSTHIKHLLTKLSSGLYSLNMTKNLIPYNSKKLLYYANIQSHLNYGMCVWGPMLTKRNVKKLQVQQNKAVRALFNLNYRATLAPYFKKANILTIQGLMDLSLLKISYRYVYDNLPKRIVNLFETPSHNYSTRNRNNLQINRHVSEIYNRSYLAKSPSLWLKLPNHIRDQNIKFVVKHYYELKLSSN